jgi:NTP pyrophosphatase (non-canonical NTP hydrolase)
MSIITHIFDLLDAQVELERAKNRIDDLVLTLKLCKDSERIREQESNERIESLQNEIDGMRSKQTHVSRVMSRAVEMYGIANQLRVLQEECGELVAAINQHSRGRISLSELASEVADVVITIGYGRLACGPDIVDRFIDEKLGRLRTKVEEAYPSEYDN